MLRLYHASLPSLWLDEFGTYWAVHTGSFADFMRRVWASVRISWYLTMLLHRFPDANPFDVRAQEYELEYLHSSEHAQAALAEQYAGLPL